MDGVSPWAVTEDVLYTDWLDAVRRAANRLRRGGRQDLAAGLEQQRIEDEGLRWDKVSARAGSKGRRLYDWAMHAVTVKDQIPAEGYGHTLLIRRSKDMRKRKGQPAAHDIEYFVVHAPVATTMAAMIRVAGLRWKIEVRHLWCPSSRVRLSRCGSFLCGALGPAGAGVGARRTRPQTTQPVQLRRVGLNDPELVARNMLGGDPTAVDPVVDGGGGHPQCRRQPRDRPLFGLQTGDHGRRRAGDPGTDVVAGHQCAHLIRAEPCGRLGRA